MVYSNVGKVALWQIPVYNNFIIKYVFHSNKQGRNAMGILLSSVLKGHFVFP